MGGGGYLGGGEGGSGDGVCSMTGNRHGRSPPQLPPAATEQARPGERHTVTNNVTPPPPSHPPRYTRHSPSVHSQAAALDSIVPELDGGGARE